MSRFGTHPYLSTRFWMDRENQYWETGMYSEETKNKMRKWLAKKTSEERNLANMQHPIKNQNNFL